MKNAYTLIISLTLMVVLSACSSSNQPDTNKVKYLSDNYGMTLYTFDKDTQNKSNCYNGCEAKWPVFYGTIDEAKLPSGIEKSDFGTITRDNGAKQTTYKSQPLYYFFKDNAPKVKSGDGVKGVWHIVK